MLLKKSQWALIAITACFIFAALILFIGRGLPFPAVITNRSETEDTSSIGANGRININTATVDQLSLLPDIGPKIAQRIIDYREENGSFSSIEELLLIKGIGKKRLEELRDYITLGG